LSDVLAGDDLRAASGELRELLFQAPSLGVGLRAVPFRLHDDIAGLLVGQVLVLLVKVFDLVWLLGGEAAGRLLRASTCHLPS
jgi:hypothetical protein